MSMTKKKATHFAQMNRRQFLQTSGTIASVASIAGNVTLSFSAQAKSTGIMSDEIIKYSDCLVNYGSRCPPKVHVKDNVIQHISNKIFYDDAKFSEHQIRLCLLGRSVCWKTYNLDRLKYPMLRVGKRGEGKFKKISWDEVTTIIVQKLKEAIEKYGNEAIYYQYGTDSTGVNLHGRIACKRLLVLIGGFLGDYGTYSYAN